MQDLLFDLLNTRLSAEASKWLHTATSAGKSGTLNSVLAHYTSASQRVGKTALMLNAEEKDRLRLKNRVLAIDHWGCDETARALILLSLSERSIDEYAMFAHRCYELGDSREQQSWLRSLSVLPHGELFLQTAIDSCRTNIIPLFEAIACENPYPSIYFPELNFNQMVLKCLFNRIALARVAGLESRLNSELSRMADHYESELRAAGREVPPDIHLTHEQYISRRGPSNENV